MSIYDGPQRQVRKIQDEMDNKFFNDCMKLFDASKMGKPVIPIEPPVKRKEPWVPKEREYEGMALGGCRDGEILAHDSRVLRQIPAKMEKDNGQARDYFGPSSSEYHYTQMEFQNGPGIGFWIESSLKRHAKTPRELVELLIACYMGEEI